MNPRLTEYPPIGKHGIIGDRRTAALVAADGTIDWLCVPDYDDDVLFGALLDPQRGGFCRFGPATPRLGSQTYQSATVTLVTRWEDEDGVTELHDLMPWPGRDRPQQQEQRRVVLRCLRVMHGKARVRFDLWPRWTFNAAPKAGRRGDGVCFQFDQYHIGLWASFAVELAEHTAAAEFTLSAGEEAWTMIGLNEELTGWSTLRCQELRAQTDRYWRDWTRELKAPPDMESRLQRCAITVHLLAHAPNDAVIAAATTSLPERLGGDRNYDYRYTWVRDASISVAFLATMGKPRDVARYLDWLCDRESTTAAPLQICYRTDGQTDLTERPIEGIAGYLGSLPARFGNRAFRQRQLGSLGWLADSALIFLEAGGDWKPKFWSLIRRSADYVCDHWREPDNGVWELDICAPFVESKVMAWVTIDRALRIAGRVEEKAPDRWAEARHEIREDVLANGWSEKLGAFRQRYDTDTLDAAALLIPLMDFLPCDDPRVIGTLDAIERILVIDGLVHRFDPTATLGGEQLPIGEFEGAFLPATFWYAQALARAGRREQAAAVLRRCEEIAGPPGIFAEEADGKRGTFLGNTPLLFSQVEYSRALLAVERSQAHSPLKDL